jgi:hypothetical protein
MARTMTVDSTDVYRALVSRKTVNGIIQNAYGPHSSRAHARDHQSHTRFAPARVEKQKLVAGVDFSLSWVTVDTKYTNGGEDVNWDA